MENYIKKTDYEKILMTDVEFTLEADSSQTWRHVGPSMWGGSVLLTWRQERPGKHPCHSEDTITRKWASLSILEY